jgi:SNF2 family DNA or RNA helicase
MGKKKLPGKKRAALIADPESKIVITNFASLNMPDVLKALQAKNFQYIVVDEIHEFKGYDSKRLKNLLSFSDKATFRLGLTGTLILNGYEDVWGPSRILDKGKRFGTNFFSGFRRKYFVDVNAHMPAHIHFPDWQLKPECAAEVTERLASLASRRSKEECLSLPPRVVMQEEVELSEDQQRAYDEMENELIAEVMAGTVTASNALVKMLRMRQILSGFMPVMQDEDPDTARVHYFKSNPRLNRLAELGEQITKNSKLVVWSNFRAMYPKLREMAAAQGRGFAELTGETKDRQAEIERFQTDPNCRYFFSNPQAGGTGVDGLQHVANYCLYYDRSHNLAHYLQSRERVHRRGSEVHTSVTELHLVTPNTLDVEIHQALLMKESFADNVLERLRLRYGQGRRG